MPVPRRRYLRRRELVRETLDTLATHLRSLRRVDEDFAASFYGEQSEFARFSKSTPHQVGSVEQSELDLRWIVGRRQAQMSLSLSGQPEEDRDRVGRAVGRLRQVAEACREDPYLTLPTEIAESERIAQNDDADARQQLDCFCQLHQNVDAVGVMAAGPQYVGFANGSGQHNWQAVWSHHFDWSVHEPSGRAVKANYADFQFDADALAGRAESVREAQRALRGNIKTLKPGRYRVYLTPEALDEILGLISWDGFSLRAQRTRATSLRKLVEGDAALHPTVNIYEDTARGLAPNFDELGFARPDRVALVAEGRHADALISPRSSAEYDVPTNGASAHEAPLSLDVGPGSLDAERALGELGTGIYISNLWYSNFSDRNACRTTGMTRFATLWVENGQAVAPVEVMRFDDTLYRMLGDKLVGLTSQTHFLPDPGTYERRSVRSARLPGALIDDFTLTL